MFNAGINELNQMVQIIAIDGPAASGKTSLGKAIAKNLNINFLDTGKIYRLLVWFYQSKKLNFEKFKTIDLRKDLSFFIQNLKFQESKFYFNDVAINNDEIFNVEIDRLLPLLVNLRFIRHTVVRLCQKWSEDKNIVMVGRDTTTVIAPFAQVKFYIHADLETRLKRKYFFLKKRNNLNVVKENNTTPTDTELHKDLMYLQIKKTLKQRDKNDFQRKIGPLKQAIDAFQIDNTKLTFEDNLLLMMQIIRERQHILPKIAIIGQTNVGKSTLFNALAQEKITLISQIANTTRDTYTQIINLEQHFFSLTDTGGITRDKDLLAQEIHQRTETIIQQSDWLFWVVDFRAPLNEHDLYISQQIKHHKAKTILIINKAEQFTNIHQIQHFDQLGIKIKIPISAKNRLHFATLFQWIRSHVTKQLKNIDALTKNKEILILGQPNVGKSSLFNGFCRQTKSIVFDQPHTTTNLVKEFVVHKNYFLHFFDSAGMRKKKFKADLIEKKAFWQITEKIKMVNLVLFVCDVSEELTVQDKKIVDLILNFKKKFIIVGNKWDLIKENDVQLIKKTQQFFTFLRKKNIDVFLTSSLNTLKGQRSLNRLLDKICEF